MNNSKLLQKCIDELNKEGFKKDYVLGILETLVEMNSQPSISTPSMAPYTQPNPLVPPYVVTSSLPSDEVNEYNSYVTTPGPIANLR